MTENNENVEPATPPATKLGVFEQLGKRLDERPEIQAAEDAVRQARAQLEKAQVYCDDLRQRAAAEMKEWRTKNLGDVVEGAKKFVRKNPGVGVGLSALLGFFVGRLFRR